MKKLMAVGVMMMCGCLFAAKGSSEERIAALEEIVTWPPCCSNEDDYVPPEEDVRLRYELTRDEFLQDLLTLANKYDRNETNEYHRLARKLAVANVSVYGGTNELPYLSAIWHDSQDYAQREALLGAMFINAHSEDVFDIANEVLTNATSFSISLREAVYLRLGNYFWYDATAVQEQKNRIANYFLSRVDLEREHIYAFLDREVCEMFPSYRHSQRRRDNLAAVYDPTLTGAPKEIYEARVRDAQPVEE